MPTTTQDEKFLESRKEVQNQKFVNIHPDCTEARFSDENALKAVEAIESGTSAAVRKIAGAPASKMTEATGKAASWAIGQAAGQHAADSTKTATRSFAEGIVNAIDGVRMQECSKPKHEYDAKIAGEKAKEASVAAGHAKRIEDITTRLASPAKVNMAPASQDENASKRVDQLLDQLVPKPSPTITPAYKGPVPTAAPKAAPAPTPPPAPAPAPAIGPGHPRWIPTHQITLSGRGGSLGFGFRF